MQTRSRHLNSPSLPIAWLIELVTTLIPVVIVFVTTRWRKWDIKSFESARWNKETSVLYRSKIIKYQFYCTLNASRAGRHRNLWPRTLDGSSNTFLTWISTETRPATNVIQHIRSHHTTTWHIISSPGYSNKLSCPTTWNVAPQKCTSNDKLLESRCMLNELNRLLAHLKFSLYRYAWQKAKVDDSPALRHESDLDNTVEVLLIGLKNVIFFPLDAIDYQCGDTTIVVPKKETVIDDSDSEDDSVEVTLPQPFPPPHGVTVKQKAQYGSVSSASSVTSCSTRRRRRRIYRI